MQFMACASLEMGFHLVFDQVRSKSHKFRIVSHSGVRQGQYEAQFQKEIGWVTIAGCVVERNQLSRVLVALFLRF